MPPPAERRKMSRQRRRARGLRELRLVVADARSRAVRRRVAKQVASLDPDRERDALQWIEWVSEFEADATPCGGHRADRRLSEEPCLGGGLPVDFRVGGGSGFSRHYRAKARKWTAAQIAGDGRQAGHREA